MFAISTVIKGLRCSDGNVGVRGEDDAAGGAVARGLARGACTYPLVYKIEGLFLYEYVKYILKILWKSNLYILLTVYIIVERKHMFLY